MSKEIQVAIDGPASAGKSTVAKLVAKRFKYIYCDTGAMYRAIAWLALDHQLSMDDVDAISELAKQAKIEFKPGDEEQRVFVNGTEVTKAIRGNKVSQNVSAVAAIPAVRTEMTRQQREIADKGGIVMDGRDIGTTVLPHAQVKIFLVASAHERARRRYEENQEKGIHTGTLAELQAAIELRDKKDSTRKVSPLVQAADAIKLDSTHLTIDQVVDQISAIITKNINN